MSARPYQSDCDIKQTESPVLERSENKQFRWVGIFLSASLLHRSSPIPADQTGEEDEAKPRPYRRSEAVSEKRCLARNQSALRRPAVSRPRCHDHQRTVDLRQRRHRHDNGVRYGRRFDQCKLGIPRCLRHDRYQLGLGASCLQHQ